MIRGKVKKGVVPKISDKNTELMRVLHKAMYGNARYTDEQIAYFYILWNGNHTQAAIDLGCAPMTMWVRIHQLNSGSMPGIVDKFHGKKKRLPRSDAKVLEEDFILV